MRTKLAIAGLGIGIAVAVLPTAPASANCWVVVEGGPCYNPCSTAASLYDKVDAAASDKLPDANCPA